MIAKSSHLHHVYCTTQGHAASREFLGQPESVPYPLALQFSRTVCLGAHTGEMVETPNGVLEMPEFGLTEEEKAYHGPPDDRRALMNHRKWLQVCWPLCSRCSCSWLDLWHRCPLTLGTARGRLPKTLLVPHWGLPRLSCQITAIGAAGFFMCYEMFAPCSASALPIPPANFVMSCPRAGGGRRRPRGS